MFNCIYVPSGQRFVINVGNGFKVAQGNILRHLFSIQFETVAFYHFIKTWLVEIHSCNLKFFQIAMLVVFFLQEKNFMPSIRCAQLDTPIEIINGWRVQVRDEKYFDSRSYPQLKTMKYYKNQVPSFFNFYRNFDFKNNVLDLYSGERINFNDYSYSFNGRNVMNSILVDLEQNASAGVRHNDFEQFVEICEFSYDALRN